MYDMPSLMYVIHSLICCMPCFINLCQFFHMLYAIFNVFGIIIRLWYAKILTCYTKTFSRLVNFKKTLHINRHVVCWNVYILDHYSLTLYQDFHFCCILFSNFGHINFYMLHDNLTNVCCIKICPRFHFCHHPIQWEVIITCSSLLV